MRLNDFKENAQMVAFVMSKQGFDNSLPQQNNLWVNKKNKDLSGDLDSPHTINSIHGNDCFFLFMHIVEMVIPPAPLSLNDCVALIALIDSLKNYEDLIKSCGG